jgi:hypothetical protein
MANTRVQAEADAEDRADAHAHAPNASRFIICACFTNSFATFEPVNISVTRAHIPVTRAHIAVTHIPFTSAHIPVTSAVADNLGWRW